MTLPIIAAEPLELKFYRYHPFSDDDIIHLKSIVSEYCRGVTAPEPADLIRIGNILFSRSRNDSMLCYDYAIKEAIKNSDPLSHAYALINISKVIKLDESSSTSIIENLHKAVSILKNTIYYNMYGRANFYAAQMANGIEAELSLYKEALKGYQAAKMKEETAYTLEKIAALTQHTDKPEAIRILNHALGIYHEIGEAREEARIHNDIGRLYFDQFDYESPYYHHSTALMLYQNLNLPLETADTQYLLGNTLSTNGEADEKFELLQAALTYYTTADIDYRYYIDQRIVLSCYCLGISLEGLNLHRKALEYYLMIHNIGNKSNNKTHIEMSSKYIGYIYYKLNDYEQAVQYLTIALDCMPPLKEYAEITMKIGHCHLNKGRWAKAVKFYKKSFYDYFALHKVNEQAVAIGFMGYACIMMNSYRRAMKLQKEALKMIRTTQNKKLLAHMLYLFGSALKQKSYYREAEEYFSEALTIAKKHQIGELEKDVIGKLIMIGEDHYKHGQFEEARQCFKNTNHPLKEIKTPSTTPGTQNPKGPE